jgi:hypothetical protein
LTDSGKSLKTVVDTEKVDPRFLNLDLDQLHSDQTKSYEDSGKRALRDIGTGGCSAKSKPQIVEWAYE